MCESPHPVNFLPFFYRFEHRTLCACILVLIGCWIKISLSFFISLRGFFDKWEYYVSHTATHNHLTKRTYRRRNFQSQSKHRENKFICFHVSLIFQIQVASKNKRKRQRQNKLITISLVKYIFLFFLYNKIYGCFFLLLFNQ